MARSTLSATGPSPARMEVAGTFPSHDIVDVTFTNPNDFPIMVGTFIGIRNDLDIAITRISRSMLGRLFADTLVWLAPTIRVRNGTMRLEFAPEARHTLELDPLVVDLGFDLDAEVSIEPASFRFLDHAAAIRGVAIALRDEIAAIRIPNTDLPRLPADFVDRVVDAFFSPTQTLEHLFRDDMGLVDLQWRGALAKRPILTVPTQLAGARDDVAMRFDYRLTELRAEASALEIRVDTIELSLLVVLRSGSRPEPHPAPEMRHDFLRAGYLLPRFDFTIDIGDIDTDLELDLPGGPVTKPFEWLAEEVGEAAVKALLEWLKDDFEDEIRVAGMSYLTDMSPLIGELAVGIVREMANRDHVLRRLSIDSSDWVIEMLDPAQLAVPFVPPDPIDHRFDDIAVGVPTADPIDGPIDAGAGTRLNRIEHLVFLMMENRSFDHMLGYLSHPSFGARNDVDGLDGSAVRLSGDFVGSLATPQPDPRNEFHPDPGHSAATVARQISDGAMNGFVSEFAYRLEGAEFINPEGNLNDPERVLKFHTPDQLETYDTLTRTDMVLDRWFCSIPGATYPNRMCYYTGVTPVINNSDVLADAGYFQELTIFDLLDHEGIDWRVYESDISFLRMFARYRLDETRLRPIGEFFSRRTDLPPVTFIDPNFFGVPSRDEANDDHPPAKVSEGQDFIRSVIDHLQELAGWPRTMLVITYDEHGGFADHVPPPGTAASDFPPNSDGTPSVPLAHPNASSYGVRVPAFVVSEVVTAGGVGSRIYDHATVMRTVIERFMPQLRTSAIVPERVRRARHLGELVEPGLPVGRVRPRFAGAVAATTRPAVATEATAGDFDFVAPRGLVMRPGLSDARVSRDSDSVRLHRARPQDTEDFATLLRQLGNPF